MKTRLVRPSSWALAAALVLGGTAALSGHAWPDARAQRRSVSEKRAATQPRLTATAATASKSPRGGKGAIVQKPHALPLVENEYSKVFTFGTPERIRTIRPAIPISRSTRPP